MIKTSKLFRNSFQIFQNYLRFASGSESRSVTAQQTAQPTTQQEEIPVHLRPYDKNKYEIPSSKLKVISDSFPLLIRVVRYWLRPS